MQASPLRVAVVHTPYWNTSELDSRRDSSRNVYIPALLSFRRTDTEDYNLLHPTSPRSSTHNETRISKNCGCSVEQPLDLTSDSEGEDSEQPSNPVDASAAATPRSGEPSEIIQNFNMTDDERLFLLGDEGRQEVGSRPIQPAQKPTAVPYKKRKHNNEVYELVKQISIERKRHEYERWVECSLDSLFSLASRYST
ncbi:hypothetical protein NW762_006518 [Fusarium torreyae]|uniref:Uncharacterized protein n=1 Tax=Fusarium torreyae TaxID=1237075 RepID=A0A9W8S232_9HYPO|nr:hypothetical protein NW762_006518 [Fusarium torreyae]